MNYNEDTFYQMTEEFFGKNIPTGGHVKFNRPLKINPFLNEKRQVNTHLQNKLQKMAKGSRIIPSDSYKKENKKNPIEHKKYSSSLYQKKWDMLEREYAAAEDEMENQVALEGICR